MKSLNEIIKRLPPEYEKEVQDFIKFLMEKRAKKHRGKPKFDWAGALKDLRNQYTSVELQHKIVELRIGGK
ncbi:MAG: DUF2281 domain-containing protein [Nitrospirota bacterium]